MRINASCVGHSLTHGPMTSGYRPNVQTPVTSYFVDRHSGQQIWHVTEYTRTGTSKSWSGDDYPRTAVESPLPVDKNGNIVWRDFRAAGAKPPVAEHRYECYIADEDIGQCTYTLPVEVNPSLSMIRAVPSASVHYQVYDPEPEMRVSLANKLGEKIAGSDFHAGTFVAEAPEALSMIASTATRLALLGRAVKRANVSEVIRLLGTDAASLKRKGNAARWAKHSAAGRWLELQYGWMPLLSDVRGGAEFLAHHFNSPQLRRVRVREKHTGSYQLLDGCTGGSEHVRLQVVAVIREQPSVVQLAGLTDPLTVAWNLVPFSFVADWVLPIGDWLQARNVMRTLGDASTTFVVTRSGMTTYSGRPYYPDLRVSVSGPYYYRRLHVRRTVESSIVPSKPSVKRLDEIFSGWKRAANAIALVQSVFGSRR